MKTNTPYTTLFALAVGVGVGVLIAPAKGKDTRKNLMKAATGLQDTLHYAALRGSEAIKHTAEKVAEPAAV